MGNRNEPRKVEITHNTPSSAEFKTTVSVLPARPCDMLTPAPSLQLYQDTSRQTLVEQIDTFVNTYFQGASLRYSIEDRKVRYTRENGYSWLCGESDAVLLIEKEFTPKIEKRLNIFLNKAMAVILAPIPENIRQAQLTLENLFIDGEHPFDAQQSEVNPFRIRRRTSERSIPLTEDTMNPMSMRPVVRQPNRPLVEIATEPETEEQRLRNALEGLASSDGARESLRQFAESISSVVASESESVPEDSPERDAFIEKIDALLAEDDEPESQNDEDWLPKAAPTR